MRYRRLTKLALIGAGALSVAALSNYDPSSSGVVRFGRAATTIGQIAYTYKTRPTSLDKVEDETFRSKCHTTAAKKLLSMCQKNGGAFIKVGQHVAALDYLVPPEYTSLLKILHHEVPRNSLTDVKKVLRKELKTEPDEIFESIEQEPLGVASLAQVHKAKLKSGDVVALRIQHPEVDAHSQVDIATMDMMVKFVAWLFPEFQFMWLADEMKKNLPLELDFLNEGKNSEIVKKKFSNLTWLKIPKIHWDISTKKVLVMDFCEGSYVTDKEYMKENGITPQQVSDRLGLLFSEMIFVDGHVHCDPHPGNFLVSKENNEVKLALLDHGLYTTLSPKFRIQYCSLWLSVLTKDTEGIKHWAKELGVGELHALLASILTARTWSSIGKGIDKHHMTEEENTEIKTAIGGYFYEIADILNRVPREMILLFKTNDLLRNIEHALGTRQSGRPFIAMTKACVQALTTDKLEKCKTWSCRFQVNFNYYKIIVQLILHQLFSRVVDIGASFINS